MPIGSTLFYFQRRRSPAPPELPPPEPPDIRCRLRRDVPAHRRLHPLFAHHKPGQELAQGSCRGTGECWASTRSMIEPAKNLPVSSRLSSNASDDQLPDAVRQAKERLLRRLRILHSSGTRQTTTASEAMSAGTNLPAYCDISGSGDGRLGSLTSFEFSGSLATHKVQESTEEYFTNVHSDMSIAKCSKPVLKQQGAFNGTKEDEDADSSADCSICLEGCQDADGLIQLHCKHIFHLACLEQWLKSHGDCPYCRASVLLMTE